MVTGLNAHILAIAHRASKVCNAPVMYRNDNVTNASSTSQPAPNRKGIWITVAMITFLAICWIPLLIEMVFVVPGLLDTISGCLISAYAVVNPLLYGLGNKNIRQKMIFTCK